MTTVTARGVMCLILKEVMRLHGIPESIVSDRDTKFTSIFWKELHKLMGSKLLMSTVFHPQTDGATERANRSIAQILHTVVSNDQKDWSEKCPKVEFAINSSINATTGYTLFKLNYGYMPQSGVRALARLDLFPFLSPFSLYGLSYCMPELTSLTYYCAPS